jgi:hypothetical protein
MSNIHIGSKEEEDIMKKEYDVLFTPSKIGTLEIKNRFVVPAMSFTDVITWSNHSQTENRIEGKKNRILYS